ncbi:monovalent cation/H+ antiporter complex subunit F [Brumicola pallidula]|uniref:Uncharacterized protein n=1 Tax=Brumicola pallidula DSM 14239 = ACAM 615 TaxID=1121922 RepID=K6ZHZ4_9ALTE|nr:hypothetical protein GPAL_1649 [Glaciecola pallidula DSM 14239 = ACAM 615]
MLVAIFAFFTVRHDLLDISVLYSLLNFVGVIAALRLVERGKFFANNSVIEKGTKMSTKLTPHTTDPMQ